MILSEYGSIELTMTRTERLLSLLQAMRRRRHPVSGATLADELGISIRTLYRDIALLQAQGANIEGEPGVGYVLRPGYMLPPLMFSQVELEALMLGMRWVRNVGDAPMTLAASDVIAKISAVIPEGLKDELENAAVLVSPRTCHDAESVDLEILRDATRKEHKIQITYIDSNRSKSQRVLWPIALGYFEEMRILVAWCELRNDFRHFRTDRMRSLTKIEARYPRKRQVLLKQWQKTQLKKPYAPTSHYRQ